MSNEITVNLSVQVSKGYYKYPFNPGSVQIDQSNIGGHVPIQIVGSAAEEVVSHGDVATLGWFFGRNLDTGNYVDIGPSTSTGGSMYKMLKVKPGEVFACRLSTGVIIKAQANTADVKMHFGFLED